MTQLFDIQKDTQYPIGIRDFARLPEVGVSHKNVIQAIDTGRITAVIKTGRGRQLQMPDALDQWLATHNPAKSGRETVIVDADGQEINYLQERALLTRQQRIKTELEVSALRGLLLWRPDLEQYWTDMIGGVVARIAGMPSAIAAELAPLTAVSSPEIEALTTRLVNEVRAELASYDHDRYRDIARANGRTVLPDGG